MTGEVDGWTDVSVVELTWVLVTLACDGPAGGVFQYFIKIVPTIYSDISSSVHSYQVGSAHCWGRTDCRVLPSVLFVHFTLILSCGTGGGCVVLVYAAGSVLGPVRTNVGTSRFARAYSGSLVVVVLDFVELCLHLTHSLRVSGSQLLVACCL